MPATIKLNEVNEQSIRVAFPQGIVVTIDSAEVNIMSLDDLLYYIQVSYGNRFFISRNEDNTSEDFILRLQSHIRTFTPFIKASYTSMITEYAQEYRTEFEKKYFKKGTETEGNAQGARTNTATNDPYTVTETQSVTTDNDTVTWNDEQKNVRSLTTSTITNTTNAVTDTITRSYGIIDAVNNAHTVTDTERRKFDPNVLNEVENEIKMKFADFALKMFMRFIDRWTYYCMTFGGEFS